MTEEEALETVEAVVSQLMARGRLLLEVEVTNREQALQIARLVYATGKPMAGVVKGAGWDTVAVPRADADMLSTLRELFKQDKGG